MLRHIVMWKLKDPSDAPRVKALLDSCKGCVPGMLEFDVGIRQEGLEANMDVVLVSGFTDQAALDAYQSHPHHEVVKKNFPPRESRTVVDYIA